MLIILILTLVCCAVADTDTSLCMKSCTRETTAEPCLPADCDPIGNNCCRSKTGNSTVIDLRSCNLSELRANIFLEDPLLRNQTNSVQKICLDQNPIGPGGISVDTFRGLTSLDILIVPAAFGSCPGGDDYWTEKNNVSTALHCEGQIAPCTRNTSEPCPQKSHCVDDGPGLMRCECNDGYYGYKCLKTGQFPYAVFYGSLGAATVVLSAVLWFIGRRKIGLHTKQS